MKGNVFLCGTAAFVKPAASLVLAVAAASCGTVELERTSGAAGVLPADTLQQEAAGKEKYLYVTGIEYPDGYDWHSDSGYGHVACTLFLMKGGERILELPVEDESFISSDHDMHRCVGGHLYTDYSTDAGTVISKDGVEMFRYPDREMICGMMVDGDDIYTLGVPRTGDGWTYRKNGMILMVKASGHPMTDLREDRGKLWFAYAEPIAYDGGVRYRCYLAVDGTASPVGVAEDMEAVDDVLLYDGTLYYTARAEGISGHLVYVGGNIHEVDKGIADETLDCRVYYDGGSCIYVSGKKCFDSSGRYDTLWKNFKYMFSYADNRVAAYYIDGDFINYILLTQDSSGRDRMAVFRNDILVGMGDYEYDHTFLGSQCSCSEDGHMYVALHPVQPGVRPAILLDDEVKEYDFNGYFTSVSVW